MIRVERPVARTAAGLVLATLLSMSVAACSHLSGLHPSSLWPWHRKPAPPPTDVHELLETGPGGTVATYPQYWKRNTLVVDLQTANGSGSVMLAPREGTTWPVRLAFRVMPGSVGALEVHAEQRKVLPITPDGSKPVDLELEPGVFTPKTDRIFVGWGPAPQPEEQPAAQPAQ